MEKKYKLTDEYIKFNKRTLYRIEALKGFRDVEKGDKGGFIEDEHNLSHYGDSWVCDNARVFGNASVFGNARVFVDARVFGNASVFGNARVFGNASVFGDARVYGDARVFGDAKIENNSDYIVFKNWWSSGRYFTWTRSNNMWSVGCFYGTGEDLIKKAYKDSELSGREYERIVKYVEEIRKDNGK